MSDLSLILLTLQVATVATIMNLPVALAISWLVVKYRVRGRSIIDVIVSLPLAVPPVGKARVPADDSGAIANRPRDGCASP